MNKYKIFDINKGLMSDDIIIEAKSPIDACKAAGYKNAVRDNYGNLVVRGTRASYVYRGSLS